MAQLIKHDGEMLDGIIRLPLVITVELLIELGSGPTVAAMALGTRWLADNLRTGQSSVIYECQGVDVKASLEDDDDGWYVLVEPCSAAAFGVDESGF